MKHEFSTLMDKLSVFLPDGRLIELSLSPFEATLAGCFIEDALTADDAADSLYFEEASHG
jgi:hypothetical protein